MICHCFLGSPQRKEYTDLKCLVLNTSIKKIFLVKKDNLLLSLREILLKEHARNTYKRTFLFFC